MKQMTLCPPYPHENIGLIIFEEDYRLLFYCEIGLVEIIGLVYVTKWLYVVYFRK